MHLANHHQLTYCLNVHPGETWADQRHAIQQYLPRLKAQVSPLHPLGLGLRISAAAARELHNDEAIEELKALLDAKGLYVFTINGFPFGRFHGAAVKEKVYEPDWSTVERLEYTLMLSNILADLLPEHTEGSISTVPISFKGWMEKDDLSFSTAVEQLVDVAWHLHELETTCQRTIHLGLEPEPCCFLETTDECIAFFTESLWKQGADHLCTTQGIEFETAVRLLKRHIGVCFDCCHLALQYEELEASMIKLTQAGILISKIHLSAALKLTDMTQLYLLEPFVEPVYLHQVKGRSAKGIASWTDLPQALNELSKQNRLSEVRVHFHVPLCWQGAEPLESTRDAMDECFWSWIGMQQNLQLEIETYTWDVLPEDVRTQGLADSLAAEFKWVLKQLDPVEDSSSGGLIPA